MTRDYLTEARSSDVLVAAQFAEPEDALHHGVKGMKWGVRRSSSQLKAAAAKRSAEGDGKPAAGGAKPAAGSPKPAAKPAAAETQAQRYARLATAIKDGQGRALDNEDLNFFNARTEALRKIDALNKTDPSWISKTTKEVLQNAAKKGMQSVADGLVTKHVSGPLVGRINNPPART